MVRLTVGLGVWLIMASLSMAGAVSPVKSAPTLGDRLPSDSLVRLVQGPADSTTRAQPAKKDSFVITDQTEIQVDGKPCRYGEVPTGAAIVLLEVAADGRTVMKVHFRTGK